MSGRPDRLLMAALVISALVCGSAAAASNPPVCNLVVDPAGDERAPVSGGPAVSGPSLDIVSSDVATDETRLTGVIRLRDLRVPEPAAPGGLRYELSFAAGDDRFSLVAHLHPDGSTFALTVAGGATAGGATALGSSYVGPVAGVLDLARDEVRMTAQLALFDTHYPIRVGDELYGFEVESAYSFGFTEPQAAVSESADFAAERKSRYPVGSRSCVRIGR